jgi:[ribosomal protein S5]-alanine N-acetyltransferase
VTSVPSVQEGHAPPSWPLGIFALRPMRQSDSAAWYGYLADPRVIEHTSIPELTPTLVETMVARELDGYLAGTSCRWALADANDRLVGTCGFSNWSLTHSHAEVVYDLASVFWGRGLMRAAVQQVLAWAFNNAGFNRVHGFVMTSNVPSIRLLEAVGFSREGTLRRFRVARGVARDFYVYAVLRT